MTVQNFTGRFMLFEILLCICYAKRILQALTNLFLTVSLHSFNSINKLKIKHHTLNKSALSFETLS